MILKKLELEWEKEASRRDAWINHQVEKAYSKQEDDKKSGKKKSRKGQQDEIMSKINDLVEGRVWN